MIAIRNVLSFFLCAPYTAGPCHVSPSQSVCGTPTGRFGNPSVFIFLRCPARSRYAAFSETRSPSSRSAARRIARTVHPGFVSARSSSMATAFSERARARARSLRGRRSRASMPPNCHARYQRKIVGTETVTGSPSEPVLTFAASRRAASRSDSPGVRCRSGAITEYRQRAVSEVFMIKLVSHHPAIAKWPGCVGGCRARSGAPVFQLRARENFSELGGRRRRGGQGIAQEGVYVPVERSFSA